MKALLSAFLLLLVAAFARTDERPAPPVSSLCTLEDKAVEGSHENVRVAGVYGPGFDHSVLRDFACPHDNGTWVELDLKSRHNTHQLRQLLESSREAAVVFVGEFYGPPVPESRLPVAIRKSYHPGWGHLAAFRTKLVIHAIESVRTVPQHVNHN